MIKHHSDREQTLVTAIKMWFFDNLLFFVKGSNLDDDCYCGSRVGFGTISDNLTQTHNLYHSFGTTPLRKSIALAIAKMLGNQNLFAIASHTGCPRKSFRLLNLNNFAKF